MGGAARWCEGVGMGRSVGARIQPWESFFVL